MKIVNKHIPFKGYIAMAIFPFIFIRSDKEERYTAIVDNHEKIHFQQQKEMLIIFFYLWYIIEYCIKFFKYGLNAYYHLSFEREAYKYEKDLNYIKNRKYFSWFSFI